MATTTVKKEKDFSLFERLEDEAYGGSGPSNGKLKSGSNFGVRKQLQQNNESFGYNLARTGPNICPFHRTD